MTNNLGNKKRTRRRPDTDDQKPQNMPTEQLRPVETTREREKKQMNIRNRAHQGERRRNENRND